MNDSIPSIGTQLDAKFARLATEDDVGRVETRLDRVDADVAVLKADVAVLKADVAVLKADVATLKADVAALRVDFAGLRAEFGDLRTLVASLRRDIVDDIGHIVNTQIGLVAVTSNENMEELEDHLPAARLKRLRGRPAGTGDD